MRPLCILLLPVLILLTDADAGKWDFDREDWSSKDDTGCGTWADEFESPGYSVYTEPFLDSDGMSYSEFSDFMEDRSLNGLGNGIPALQGSRHHGSGFHHGYSSGVYRWLMYIHGWEMEIESLRGFGNLLMNLNLSRNQMLYLDALTSYVQYEMDEMREYCGIDDIRLDFFEAFIDDFYMPIEIYFIWDERSWYDSEVHDLLAYAVGEIHDMLSESQLDSAEEIVHQLSEHTDRY